MSRMTLSPPGSSWITRPSIRSIRSSRSAATRSITLSWTASSPVIDTEFRTASSAHCSLRPRCLAIPRMSAAASLVTFSRRSPSISSPLPEIGCAAPICVLGAMAAIWPARVMNVPADAALAPAGLTNTITGISAARIRCTMSSVDEISPPGVSIIRIQAAASCRSARSRARPTKFAETGPISCAMLDTCSAPGGLSDPHALSMAEPRPSPSRTTASARRGRRSNNLIHQE